MKYWNVHDAIWILLNSILLEDKLNVDCYHRNSDVILQIIISMVQWKNIKCSKADTQKVISLLSLLTCSLKERCIKGKINNPTTDGTMELRALIFVIWSDFIGKSHFNISCSNASMTLSLSAEREFLSFVPFCESNRVKCIFELQFHLFYLKMWTDFPMLGTHCTDRHSARRARYNNCRNMCRFCKRNNYSVYVSNWDNLKYMNELEMHFVWFVLHRNQMNIEIIMQLNADNKVQRVY